MWEDKAVSWEGWYWGGSGLIHLLSIWVIGIDSGC